MAFEIRKAQEPYFPAKKPRKNAGYLSFIRKLPCCVTGRYPVEAAHLSFAAPKYGHYGRGKGSKAPDRWALPLHPDEHRKQHSMGERDYWEGENPHVLALTIWGLFSDMGDDAELFATAIINARTMGYGND